MPFQPYSYRSDPAVPAFDDTAPLVIFDGLCVLCSSGVKFMLDHDPAGATRFAVIQSLVPRALYKHYDLDAHRFETFMVLMGGQPYLRWAGVLAAARTMPVPWQWLGQAGRIVPDALGDRIYDVVQRNRLNWFGRRDACFKPEPARDRRFLPAG